MRMRKGFGWGGEVVPGPEGGRLGRTLESGLCCMLHTGLSVLWGSILPPDVWIGFMEVVGFKNGAVLNRSCMRCFLRSIVVGVKAEV
jgi:hypothetical protein